MIRVSTIFSQILHWTMPTRASWSRLVPDRGCVRSDEIISLYKLARSSECDLFQRRIEVWDEEQQHTLVFLTSHRGLAASTIAAIYRPR